MGKYSKVSEATREAFIKAFCHYYMERPIEKITVKEITTLAGYSRVTFYNYFKDPYDLLEYIEADFMEFMRQRVASNIVRDPGLDNFLEAFVAVINEKEMYSQVLLNNPHSQISIERIKSSITPIFLTLFNISPDNTKAVYAFEFYVSGVMAIISRWLRMDCELPVEDLAGIVEKYLKNGLMVHL